MSIGDHDRLIWQFRLPRFPAPPEYVAAVNAAKRRRPGPVAVRIVCHLCGNAFVGGVHIEGREHVRRTSALIRKVPARFVEILNDPVRNQEYERWLASLRFGDRQLRARADSQVVVHCKRHGHFDLPAPEIQAALNAYLATPRRGPRTVRTTDAGRRPAYG